MYAHADITHNLEKGLDFKSVLCCLAVTLTDQRGAGLSASGRMTHETQFPPGHWDINLL